MQHRIDTRAIKTKTSEIALGNNTKCSMKVSEYSSWESWIGRSKGGQRQAGARTH